MLIVPYVRLFDSCSSQLLPRQQESEDRGNHHPQPRSPLDTEGQQTWRFESVPGNRILSAIAMTWKYHSSNLPRRINCDHIRVLSVYMLVNSELVDCPIPVILWTYLNKSACFDKLCIIIYMTQHAHFIYYQWKKFNWLRVRVIYIHTGFEDTT